MSNRKEIVISMTSIPERINLDITNTLDSIFDKENYLLPDKLMLNLSIEEFPNKESSLPLSLLDYVAEHEAIEINFVDKNIGTYKKLLPALDRYWKKQDTLIMTIDDDCIYQHNLLRDIVDLKLQYDKCFVTTANLANFFDIPVPMGRCTLYSPELFDERVFTWLTDEMIYLNEDDFYYAFCMFIAGNVKDCRFFKTTIQNTNRSDICPAKYNTYKTFRYYSNLVRTLINRNHS